MGVSREGRDRHRALRRVVARHQAEGRGRTRRRRLPDLFRSARRRLFRGRRVPQGPMRPTDGVQRGSVMDMPLYPATRSRPASARRRMRSALPIKEAPTIHQDSRAADFLWRCAAAAGRAHRPRRAAAWRGALPITYHIGPGPAKVHLKVEFELGHQAALRRHRKDSRLDCARPVGHSRQSSRRLGERRRRSDLRPGRRAGRSARARRAAQAGMEAQAHDHLSARGTAKSRVCSARPNGPKTHADELKQHAVAYINSDSNGRGYLGVEGSHTLEKFINDVARDITDPETKLSVWKRMSTPRDRQRRMPTEARQEVAPARRPAHRRARFRLRLHGVPQPHRRRLAQSRLRRRRRRRHLSLDLRRLLLVHAFQRHGLRLRPRARADRRHDGDAPRRRRPAAVRIQRFRRHDSDLHQGAESPRAKIAGRCARTQSRARRRRLHRDDRSEAAARSAAGRNRSDVSEFRAARQRCRRALSQRRRISQGLRTRDRQRQYRARVRVAHRSERAPHRKRAQASHRRRACRIARGSSTKSTRPGFTLATP